MSGSNILGHWNLRRSNLNFRGEKINFKIVLRFLKTDRQKFLDNNITEETFFENVENELTNPQNYKYFVNLQKHISTKKNNKTRIRVSDVFLSTGLCNHDNQWLPKVFRKLYFFGKGAVYYFHKHL